MRRLLPLSLVAALILGACAPTVTFLTRVPVSTPAAESPPQPSTAVPTSTHTPAPSPTPGLQLSPDIVHGLETEIWVSGEVPSLTGLAADFNGSNPWGVKVSVVSYPNLNLLTAALNQALQDGAPPDLTLALPEQLLGWREAVLDLSPYAAHADLGLEREDLPPAFWEQSNLQGAQLGLPALRSARYLFYNLSWARELGFQNAPHTWQDFQEQACAANAVWRSDADPSNDGFGGLALEVTPNWQTPYAWLRALGGEVFSEGAYAFDSPQNAAALENLTALRDEGCAWLPSTQTNFEHLAKRKALFVSGSLSDLDQQRAAFSETVSSDEWTVIAFPGESPVVPVYGLDVAVFQSDEAHQLAAWLFARWLLQPETQARWARLTGWFPVSQTAFGLLKSDYAANAQKGAAAKLLADYSIGYPKSKTWGLANKILGDGFLYLFQAYPYATAQDVLWQMDATLQDLAE